MRQNEKLFVRRNQKNRRLAGVCLVGVCLLFGLIVKPWIARASKDAKEMRIYEGVFLDDVDVGGMTKTEAYDAYGAYIADLRQTKLTFYNEIGSYTVRLSDIGITVSVEDAVEQAYGYGRKGNILTRYKEIEGLKEKNAVLVPEKTVDEEVLSDKLTNEAVDMVNPAKNASMARVDGELIRYEGQTGHRLDVEETVKLLEEVLEKKWEAQDIEIAAVTEEEEPQYTVDDFYMVDDMLGMYSTEYDAQKENRSQNLATGAAKINGTILLPGEQFSMCDTVAPFTEENGYADAGQYVKGETGTELVNGIGGGICQVSTTLYNAVLEAELCVDERYPHALSVDYAELSRDAAIAENYMDFKFTNTTGYPVYIEGYAGGGTISFAVYGHETRDSERVIKFVSKQIEEYEPGEPEKIWDETLPAGEEVTERTSHTGYYAELWKEIYQDGELVDEIRINQSQYNSQPARIRVGTKPD